MCDKVLFLRLCEAQQGKVPARFLKKLLDRTIGLWIGMVVHPAKKIKSKIRQNENTALYVCRSTVPFGRHRFVLYVPWRKVVRWV